jgi:feruloyl esterase
MNHHARASLLVGASFFSFLATGPARAAGAIDCAKLATLAVPSTTITSAKLVGASGVFPESCRVIGYVDKEINFELRLPTAWNQKFLFQGYGGLDGAPPLQTLQLGLGSPGTPLGVQRGYAVVATDTGHATTDGSVYDGSWAYHNAERQVNWAHRSTHVVAIAAREIISAYYGRAARFSYYQGCSGGGRHAAMTAQRYPGDFDGVVAADPFLSPPGQVIAWNWNEQVLAASPIPPAKLPMIAKAVLNECDDRDGVIDGLISDPRRCRFDPGTISCPAAVDRSDCLTPPQVESLRKFYGGPRNSAGEQLFPGWEPGVEDLGWPSALVNSVNGGPGQLLVRLPDNFLKYFVFGPGFDPLSFNFDSDPIKLEPASELFDVKPDLAGFANAGGKMIMVHGWADPRLVPALSIQFHDAVRRNFEGEDERGEHKARARIRMDDFYRLFMVPGMLHCSGGTGPANFDTLAALEKWVEQGIAPDRLIGSHLTNGAVDRTRPLCPYPQEAVYTGRGSIDDAANFVCRVRHVRDTVNEDFYRSRRDDDEGHD